MRLDAFGNKSMFSEICDFFDFFFVNKIGNFPNVSERIRTRPDASERIRMHPNASEHMTVSILYPSITFHHDGVPRKVSPSFFETVISKNLAYFDFFPDL